MTHKLTTDMRGAKLKNSKDGLTYGIDTSVRNWDGKYYMTMVKSGQSKMTGISIDDVDTQNLGFFVEKSFKVDSIEVSVGARYDDTSIETDSPERDRDYIAFLQTSLPHICFQIELKYLEELENQIEFQMQESFIILNIKS